MAAPAPPPPGTHRGLPGKSSSGSRSGSSTRPCAGSSNRSSQRLAARSPQPVPAEGSGGNGHRERTAQGPGCAPGKGRGRSLRSGTGRDAAHESRFVIHRYAESIVGGSEFHCRRIAEEMASRHDVEVLTTTAEDYVTWKDGFAPGLETINGVKVRRFRIKAGETSFVSRRFQTFAFTRSPYRRRRARVGPGNGPETRSSSSSSGPQGRLRRFHLLQLPLLPSYFGLLEVAEKSILVPTAEEDAAVHLSIFADYFNRPSGALFLTPEEQDLVGKVAHGVLLPATSSASPWISRPDSMRQASGSGTA